MENDKLTVLVLSDHPLSPSGVGTQTRYFIEAMLKTGKYRFVCLGGAVKHADYTPAKVDPYGEDWLIFPVDGYGSQDKIRGFMLSHKPDILWFMTDPRFYGWLWEMENEIRATTPMIYYHVWDNYPYPTFNKPWYQSNDLVATISKVTSDIVRNVCPEVEETYLPHAVDTEVFKKIDKQEVISFKQQFLKNVHESEKLIFFWNNRNARRKMSGSLIYWFKEYLDDVGHDKAVLLMHTDPKDPHGQDLVGILKETGMNKGQVLLSTDKVQPQHLAMLYNVADCTINISDAEGFGLATFESLACETPIVVNMTGGLQEQVTDGENWFGIGINPASKAIIGSQQVPFIYEDRISKEDFVDSLKKITNMSNEERDNLGAAGREHVMNNYSMEQFADKWDQVLTRVHNHCGSWETRKNYKSWEFTEIK
jgi:glycosyltransferase involved in cell wall biosynthesis